MPMSSFKVVLTIAVVALSGFVWFQRHPNTEESFVAFLDVGQGDATYIRTTSGADVFIDGGPDRTILERASKMMQPFDHTIETLILTHPDADHLTGLVELVKRYAVKQIITTALPATKPLHLELLQLIEQKHIQHVMVSAGDKLQLDPAMYCLVLYPSLTIPISLLETNDTSLVLNCHLGENGMTILFTGDISSKVESQLPLSDIDILKVPHHGSKTSSSQIFLDVITPELCVIELGKDNQYGHPHQEVIDRLQQYCQIRRTDQEGTIRIDLHNDDQDT